MKKKNTDKTVEELLELHHGNQSSGNNTTEVISKLHTILGLCNTANISNDDLPKINKHLDKVLSAFNKCSTVKLESKENINCRQKIEKQLRLYSTKKKRVKRDTLSKPSVNETNSIVNGLICGKTINIHTGFDHNYT